MHPIATLWRVLGTATGGYAAWRQRPPSARAQADATESKRIRGIHVSLGGANGVTRVPAELAAKDHRLGGKRIARLVRNAHVSGVGRRNTFHTTRRNPTARPAPDLVEHRVTAAASHRLWTLAITFVPSAAGFLYLAMDVNSLGRSVARWALSRHHGY
jgi:putative transposase